MYFTTSSIVLGASLLFQQATAAALPVDAAADLIDAREVHPYEEMPEVLKRAIEARDPLHLDPHNPYCYNTWETVTNDYWYLAQPNSGVSADRMWDHLNLNGCAPTEHKYYHLPSVNGVALTFHTSEACTAARVEHAYRSSSNPPINIGCTYTGKEGVDGGEAGATAIDAAFEAFLEAFGRD